MHALKIKCTYHEIKPFLYRCCYWYRIHLVLGFPRFHWFVHANPSPHLEFLSILCQSLSKLYREIHKGEHCHHPHRFLHFQWVHQKWMEWIDLTHHHHVVVIQKYQMDWIQQIRRMGSQHFHRLKMANLMFFWWQKLEWIHCCLRNLLQSRFLLQVPIPLLRQDLDNLKVGKIKKKKSGVKIPFICLPYFPTFCTIVWIDSPKQRFIK